VDKKELTEMKFGVYQLLDYLGMVEHKKVQ
jgi:hypothetical protein